MVTKVIIDKVAVDQVQTLVSAIEEKRSLPDEGARRETIALVNQLLGKLELMLALSEDVSE